MESSGVVEDLSAKQNQAELYQVVIEFTDDRIDATTFWEVTSAWPRSIHGFLVDLELEGLAASYAG